MSYDLAIVGAGYWGVAAALLAEKIGLRVCLIDGQKEGRASVAASGYFSERWYKGVWRARIEQAFEDARELGIAFAKPGNEVHGAKPHVKGDWWMLSPEQFLGRRRPDYVAQVDTVRAGAVCIGSECVEAKVVLVAAGAWTDEILLMSGLPPIGIMGLGGTGVIYRGEAPRNLVLHQITVFKQYAIRPWGEGLVRIGETVEPKPERHAAYVRSMEETMSPYVRSLGLVRLGEVFGLRPVASRGMFVDCAAPGVWVASGGGRIGAVPSFWAARELLSKAGFA